MSLSQSVLHTADPYQSGMLGQSSFCQDTTSYIHKDSGGWRPWNFSSNDDIYECPR